MADNETKTGTADLDKSEEAIERAKKKIVDAKYWMLTNPRAWRYMADTAMHQAAEGKKVSGRQLVENVRKRDFTDTCGAPTKVNNDYAAIFARLLVAEHPQLAKHIEFRRTVLDEIM